MSAPDLTRTWRALLDAHEERPGASRSPSGAMLVILSWLCIAAVMVLGALVGLTVAHAIVTTWLNLGPTLDRSAIGGGW